MAKICYCVHEFLKGIQFCRTKCTHETNKLNFKILEKNSIYEMVWNDLTKVVLNVQIKFYFNLFS